VAPGEETVILEKKRPLTLVLLKISLPLLLS
jgi:hypothetical protein